MLLIFLLVVLELVFLDPIEINDELITLLLLRIVQLHDVLKVHASLLLL